MAMYTLKAVSAMLLLISLCVVLLLRNTDKQLGSRRLSSNMRRRLDDDGPYAGYTGGKVEIGADYSHHEELDDHAEQRRRLVAGNSPEQVHIAYGIPAVSTMVVSWAAGMPTNAPPESTVMYSENIEDIKNNKGVTANVACEKPSSYRYLSDFKRPPFPYSGTYQSPYFHHCTISKLKTHTKYYYQVGPYGGGANPPAKPFSFTTARSPGAAAHMDGKALTVAVIGDLGQTKFSEATRDAVLSAVAKDDTLDFGFIVGDMYVYDTA